MEPHTPKVGDVIRATDELGREHDALVTAYWAGDRADGALNCVFVSDDIDKTDPYGRQLERMSSVGRQNELSAHGRFWNPKS